MGNKVVANDFLEILLTLKKNIMKDLNVAEVCTITQSLSDGTYMCSTISSNLTCYAYKMQGLTISQGDIVVVLFNNTDFRNNLTKLKQGSSASSGKLADETLHSKSYGIIIGKL